MQVERTVVVADTAGPVITWGVDHHHWGVLNSRNQGAKAVDAFEGEVAYTFTHEIPQTDWVPYSSGGLGAT